MKHKTCLIVLAAMLLCSFTLGLFAQNNDAKDPQRAVRTMVYAKTAEGVFLAGTEILLNGVSQGTISGESLTIWGYILGQTVTPVLAGYTFSPSSYVVVTSGAPIFFVGTPIPSTKDITVTSTPTGQPIYVDGANSTYTTPHAFTQALGYNGLFTVVNPLYAWAPANYQVTNLQADTPIDFVGTAQILIVPVSNPEVVFAGALSWLEAPYVTMDIAAAYTCTAAINMNLKIPIISGQQSLLFIGSFWQPGNYLLNPGYATWTNVLFSFMGAMKVIVLNPDPVVTPTADTEPAIANAIAETPLPVSNPIAASYVCSCPGTHDLKVDILASQRAFAYFGSVWNEGDYALNPAYATWLDVPFGARGDVPVVIVGDATLPVTLTSFSATQTALNYVKIAWTTQSETNLMGYHVFRNTESNVGSAIKVTDSIITGTNSSSLQNYSFTDAEVATEQTYYYWLESLEMDGSSEYFGPISILVTIGGDNPSPEIPAATALHNAYPNPFNPKTNISYSITTADDVSLEIYNQKGQLVKSFVKVHTVPGTYHISWDGKDNNGRDISSGVYVYRMISKNFSTSKKFTLMK